MKTLPPKQESWGGVAGMIDPGHDDVADKIMHDFSKHRIPMTRAQILMQLSKDHHFVATHRAINN